LTENTATPAELNAEAETVVTTENITENTVESPAVEAEETTAEATAEAHAAEETAEKAEEEGVRFTDLGLDARVLAALEEVGYEKPSPIQEQTIPLLLDGHDVVGLAQTGTGKTLGFGLPTIQRVVGRDDEGWADLEYPGAPQALILVPTRELAIQVGEDLAIAAKLRNARVATLYGGVPIEPQAELLRRGLEVAVGTPGRIIDLYQQGFLNLKQVKIVVLDEADEMLDLGFQPSVEKILSYLPEARQMRLKRVYPGSTHAQPKGMDTWLTLVPRPKTMPVGGKDLVDGAMLQWAEKFINSIYAEKPQALEE